MNEKRRYKNKVLAEVAISACNSYIDIVFGSENYKDLNPAERLRVNCVLIKTNKLAARYQA